MKGKLVLQNAVFSYGEREIFSGLSFEINRGEVLCLLGSNGCGKTTLLRCIHGYLRLVAGQVLLDGFDVGRMQSAELARKIGFVFQENHAAFPYSVLEVVMMGRAPHLKLFSSPSAKDKEIAERSLEKVGIAHLRDKKFTQISGGERQLTVIARTLAQEPDVILLDEPTSALDFKNQTLVLRMINKMAEAGLIIVMSSHFPNNALLFANKVAMMHGGRFIALGDADKVINENNLRATYGIDVKIFTVEDPDRAGPVKFCVPV